MYSLAPYTLGTEIAVHDGDYNFGKILLVDRDVKSPNFGNLTTAL